MAARFMARLQMALGDQRINVLILDLETRNQPIHDKARTQGVALWHRIQTRAASSSCLKPCGKRLGTALDNLARMERPGYLPSVVNWVEARNLRNHLVHEYMRDANEFAEALQRAIELTALLEETRKRLDQAATRFTEG